MCCIMVNVFVAKVKRICLLYLGGASFGCISDEGGAGGRRWEMLGRDVIVTRFNGYL